mmetsp:Transcript_14742/g.18685  ORF Transcript_14742/g.18685 Transcript_14742/m.18685 type:complete len:235 (-) Transcript_14742:183-887(-)
MKMNLLTSLLTLLVFFAAAPVSAVDSSNIRRRALSETVASATLIPEGEPVKCLEISDVTVFRYEGGELRKYPDQFIAMTYNHDYDDEVLTYKNCAAMGFTFGPDMELYLAEGRNIICEGREPFIFRWTEGLLRHYPDPMVAASWDSHWEELLRFNCDKYNLEFGPAMELSTPDEGDVVICLEDESKVYHWTDGQLHWYINGAVASSWDPAWRDHAVRRICAPYEFGEPFVTTEH